jgi:pilus assembly protein Flp/PilA
MCASGHGLCTGGARFKGKDQVMRQLFWRFIIDEQGVTAIEYGLLAAGIAVAIIATVEALGTNLSNTYSTVSSAMQ